jgi:maleylpyruvate isomerase
MKLYSYFRSSSSYRVRVALALKGLKYEYVPIDLSPSMHAQSETGFAQVNPMRQIPVLVWSEGGGEHTLTQSVAIIEYLEERWPDPPLLPQDPLARAQVREAVQIVNSGIQPLQNPSTLKVLRDGAGKEVEDTFRNGAIRNGLAALELRASSTGPFFMGLYLSMADLFIVPQLYNARRYAVELQEFPRLREIETNCLALPAFRAAEPAQQPDAPPSF